MYLSLSSSLGNTKPGLIGLSHHLGAIKSQSPHATMGVMKYAHGGGVWDWIKDTASDAWGGVKEVAGQAWGAAKDYAKDYARD